MSRKILAIYYTQTGQLAEIINNISTALISEDTSVEYVSIKPVNDYPFPWNGEQFFSIMPNCVLDVSTPLQPFQLKEKKYDLILLGYQPWFLSPCIPINSLLDDAAFKEVLNGTPVITITGARNMWINAFQRIKNKLQINGAKVVGNIALVDKHANIISLATISFWMFKGLKEKYLGLFPKPGVSDEDIKNASLFGEIINKHFQTNTLDSLQEDIKNNKGLEVVYRLMYIENTAKRLFNLWANFIAKRDKPKIWLVLFKYYLLFAIIIVAPVVLTFDAIFIKPFSTRKIQLLTEKNSGVI